MTLRPKDKCVKEGLNHLLSTLKKDHQFPKTSGHRFLVNVTCGNNAFVGDYFPVVDWSLFGGCTTGSGIGALLMVLFMATVWLIGEHTEALWHRGIRDIRPWIHTQYLLVGYIHYCFHGIWWHQSRIAPGLSFKPNCTFLLNLSSLNNKYWGGSVQVSCGCSGWDG